MRFLIALAFVALAAGQRNPFQDVSDFFNQNKYDYTIDFIHNYRIEEHEPISSGIHLLVAISDTNADRSCHVIEVNSSWEDYLKDENDIKEVTNEIYKLITSHQAQETALTRDELRQTYGDNEALRECFNHKVYLLSYTPSFELVSGSTTAAP